MNQWPRVRSVDLLLATLALFVVSLGYGVVVPSLPRLAGGASGIASATDLSIVYASYGAAKMAAQIPGGVWVDRRGPRVVLVFALCIYVGSLLGFLLPFGPFWFAIVRAVEGIATGLVYPAVFARVLLGTTEQQTGRRLGTAVGIGSSGLLIGPVMGALLEKQHPALPILLAAALGLVVLVWALADRRRTPILERSPRITRTTRSELTALLRLARDHAFVATMLPIAFNKLTFSAFQGLLPLAGAGELGLGATGIALLFVLVGVVFALAQPTGGILIDRLGAPRVVAWALPLLLGALAALAFVSSVVPFAILFGLHIFAQSIVFTATMKHAATKHASVGTYGGVFGLLSTLTDTMTVVGPLLFLNVYARMGRSTFAVMAAVGIAFAIPFARTLSSRGGTSTDHPG